MKYLISISAILLSLTAFAKVQSVEVKATLVKFDESSFTVNFAGTDYKILKKDISGGYVPKKVGETVNMEVDFAAAKNSK
jgi:hypothetical protein